MKLYLGIFLLQASALHVARNPMNMFIFSRLKNYVWNYFLAQTLYIVAA
jgi:hypothetical protein